MLKVCKLIFLHCLALIRLQIEYCSGFVKWLKVKVNQMESEPEVQCSIIRKGFKGIRSCCVHCFVLSYTVQQTGRVFYEA